MVQLRPHERGSLTQSRASRSSGTRGTRARLIASVAAWQEEQKVSGGTYAYTHEILNFDRQGLIDQMNFEYLRDSGSAIVGDPDQVIQACKRYEATGCDLLLCLVNPLNIPHDKVMQTIELMGKYVIPEFQRGGAA